MKTKASFYRAFIKPVYRCFYKSSINTFLPQSSARYREMAFFILYKYINRQRASDITFFYKEIQYYKNSIL